MLNRSCFWCASRSESNACDEFWNISKRKSEINVYKSLFYTKIKIQSKNWPNRIGCFLHFSISYYQFENNLSISQHNLAFKFHDGLVQLQSKTTRFWNVISKLVNDIQLRNIIQLSFENAHCGGKTILRSIYFIACEIRNLLDFPELMTMDFTTIKSRSRISSSTRKSRVLVVPSEGAVSVQ